MSNPCVNRWGLKSFWHHFWYSDTFYAPNLQADQLLLKLLHLYFSFGAKRTLGLFWNSFWYKKSTVPAHFDLNIYYRWVTTYSKSEGALVTYRLRKSREEIFQARISILKFNSWLVINFYWFQPDKKKRKRALRSRIRRFLLAPIHTKKSNAPVKKIFKMTKIFTSQYEF